MPLVPGGRRAAFDHRFAVRRPQTPAPQHARRPPLGRRAQARLDAAQVITHCRLLRLDQRAGDRQRLQVGRRRRHVRGEPVHGGVAKTDARAVDFESVIADVGEPRDADALPDVGQGAPRDDHRVEVGRAARLLERPTGPLRQHRVVGTAGERRQRAVIVQEQRHRRSPRQPGGETAAHPIGGRGQRLLRPRGRGLRRLQEPAHPTVHRVGVDPVAQGRHPRASLVLGHGERAVQGLGHRVDLERVDQERFLQLLGGAGQLR